MPDMGGIDVCYQLRHDPQISLNSAIFITTAGGDTRAQRMNAYAAGAWDFCTQPVDIDVLLPKLTTFTQAKLFADRVREESLIDADTGLYNTRGLAQRAREIGAEAARRSDAVACIAFCAETDQVVDDDSPEMASFVRDVCRQNARVSDAVGRLGPNEFAIIAPSTLNDGADRIIERLRDSFASRPVVIRGAERQPRLHATYTATTNMAESSIDPLELLYGATASLRQARVLAAAGAGERSVAS
jgi:PleD family two-component response regulator